MNLLIITQVVDTDDPILGFFHAWIKEFAKYYERVTVICLKKGKYDLPENVRVYSLGKESGISRFKYLTNFYTYIVREKKNYEKVFVHMNPIYIVLGGILWRMMGKKIFLWYTHKQVDLKLRIAEKLSHGVFSASKESFRLPSKKLVIMGHGIDVDLFKPALHPVQNEHLQLCSIARISETKNQRKMIEVIDMLKLRNINATLHIVGSAITKKDMEYEDGLQKMLEGSDLVNFIVFHGNMVHDKVPEFLQRMDIFINLSDTGSLDKAVLEAMACGLEVVTSNEAFRDTLGPARMVTNNVDQITNRIIEIMKDDTTKSGSLRDIVQKDNSLSLLIATMSHII